MKLPFFRGVKDAFSGIVGGGVFVVFFFLLNTGLFIAIGASIASFIGSLFLFSSSKADDNISDGENIVSNTIDEGYMRIKMIRSFSPRLKKVQVKNNVEELCANAESILYNYKKNPMDTKAFINYYLDSMIKIISKYIELSEMSTITSEIQEMMEKSEKIIETVKNSLYKQITHLKEEDMIDLDAEISVLEKTIKAEGLG